jgi:hypothetical protein
MIDTLTATWSASGTAVTLVWTGGTAPFRLYRDAEAVGVTSDRTATLPAEPAGWPVFEVLDATDSTQPTPVFAPVFRLGFQGVAGTLGHRIEQLDGPTWRTVATLPGGTGWKDWVSPPVPDGQTRRYRVRTIAPGAADGLATDFLLTMVRHPDPPAFRDTYDPTTRVLTLAE